MMNQVSEIALSVKRTENTFSIPNRDSGSQQYLQRSTEAYNNPLLWADGKVKLPALRQKKLDVTINI